MSRVLYSFQEIAYNNNKQNDLEDLILNDEEEEENELLFGNAPSMISLLTEEQNINNTDAAATDALMPATVAPVVLRSNKNKRLYSSTFYMEDVEEEEEEEAPPSKSASPSSVFNDGVEVAKSSSTPMIFCSQPSETFEPEPPSSFFDDNEDKELEDEPPLESPFPSVDGLYVLPAFSHPFAAFCTSPPLYHPFGEDDSTHQKRTKKSRHCTLRLDSGYHMIPHPAKVQKGGEDACFVSKNGRAIGVADGVGGWGDLGVDPGLYSKQFMAGSEHAVNELNMTDPLDILSFGFESASSLTGSTTALVLAIADNGVELRSANVGDSGFMVVREGKIVYRSSEQQHQFNFPYQLGTGSQDRPQDAERASVELEEGDIIIAGTDGLFDNLDDTEIVAFVKDGCEEGWTPRQIAKVIADRAHELAGLTTGMVPFGIRAMEHGFMFQGGKMDDITVVAACVVIDDAKH